MKPVVEILIASNQTKIKQAITHQRIATSYLSGFMVDLVKLGVFTPSVPDGEDSRGNRTYRLMTPQELVARSTEICELTFKILEEKGWTAEMPPIDKLIDLSQVGFTSE